jgi:hypothetical protein
VFLCKTSWRFDGQSSDFDVKKGFHKTSYNIILPLLNNKLRNSKRFGVHKQPPKCNYNTMGARWNVYYFFYNIEDYRNVFKLVFSLMIKYKILNTWRTHWENVHTTALIQLTNDQVPFAFQNSIKTFFIFLAKENNI